MIIYYNAWFTIVVSSWYLLQKPLSVPVCYLGKIEGRYKRYTADDVPNECWKHEAHEIGEPGTRDARGYYAFIFTT